MTRARIQKKKALLVFCEGPHDVAFVRLVFKFCFCVNKVEWKFSAFPAPFNALFSQSVEKHAGQDLSLDMAHKFFLPDRVLYDNDRIILLFNSGGKSKTDKIKQFLRDFLPLLENASRFPEGADSIISEAKYLFLYDADEQGVKAVIEWVKAQFASIEKTTWDTNGWVHTEEDSSGDKAVYVWANSSGLGTLEDIVYPLFKSRREIIDNATTFVQSFDWDTASASPKRAIAEKAKQIKATLTVVGQREKPGCSMSVILDQGGKQLIGAETFKRDENVKRFAAFLRRFFMDA